MIQTMGFGTIKIYFIIQAQHTECCLYKSENQKTKTTLPMGSGSLNKNVLISRYIYVSFYKKFNFSLEDIF